MDGAQIGVFEKSNEVGFGRFLQGKNCGALEPQVHFEVVGDFTYEALEGKLPDQQVSGFLILADFTKGYGSWPVTVRFLYTTAVGADLRAAFVANCLRGALPPVDLRAVCLVRAMVGC